MESITKKHKTKQLDYSDNRSIRFDKEKNVYKVYSGSVEPVANCFINAFEYLAIKSGKIEKIVQKINEELGLNEESYSFRVETAEDRVNENDRYLATIYKYTEEVKNELPFGVFLLNYERSYGCITMSPLSNTEKKPLLVENLDLIPYAKELKNASTSRKNKKGILLYGPPGNGKTSALTSLRDFCTEENKTRMFYIHKTVSLQDLLEIRDFFKNDYTIFVFEEITERLERSGVEDILTFLDGENSWNNSLNIATTNYPEELPYNIVDRPGRLDTFIEIPNPDKSKKVALVKAFGFNEEDGEILYNKSMSFDYVSFILNKAKSDNITIKDAYEEQDKIRNKISKTFKSKGMGL